MRIQASDSQIALIQIFVDDEAHDVEREAWWPKQVGPNTIEYDETHKDDVVLLFTTIANDQENDQAFWRSATALARKVRSL